MRTAPTSLSIASEMVGARDPYAGVAKRRNTAAGTDDNAATPQLVKALTCLVQTNGGPARLLSALLCGSNRGIDARSRTAKALKCLLDSCQRLIVSHIFNGQHHAIDCTGIIRLQIDRVGSAVPESCA